VNDSLVWRGIVVALNVGTASSGLCVKVGVMVEVGDGGMAVEVGDRGMAVEVGAGELAGDVGVV
jgi:hypothetical protein